MYGWPSLLSSEHGCSKTICCHLVTPINLACAVRLFQGLAVYIVRHLDDLKLVCNSDA